MYDRNTIPLAIRSRAAGLALTGFAVAALALFVASPVSAGDRYYEHEHHIDCSHHAHHASHGHLTHNPYHRGYTNWHSGFGFGFYLPHFTLRLSHPHRLHRSNRHDVRHHYRGHRERTRHRRRDRRR